MINLAHVSACLITKDRCYPKEITDHLLGFMFGEVMILTQCDSPHRKQELFAKAKYDYIYYQDDDCIAPVEQLTERARPNIINCAMKMSHLNIYAHSRIALIGWGAIFPKSTIDVLGRYRAKYGEDVVYKRETERIMTYLSWPQHRMGLPITDLPSATAPDRLSMQPEHWGYIPLVEERCATLL